MKNKTKNIFIGFLFLMLALAFILGMISCSPQERLNRLLKKNPQLIKHDTIWKRDTITVKGIEDSTSVKENLTPDLRIDSLLRLLSICGKDSVKIKDSIRVEIKREIRVSLQKEIPDTTIIKDGIIFKIFSKRGKLNIDIKTPERKIVENIPMQVNTVQNEPVVKTGFKVDLKKLWIDIKDFFAWSGLIFWIILIISFFWKIFKPKL